MNNNKLITFVLFLFVFQNYYSPISPYLTMIANFGLFFMMALYNGRRKIHFDVPVLAMTCLILAWAMTVMILRLGMDSQVLLKYWRVAAATLLLVAACSILRVTAKQLINALGGVFLAHILAIGAQTAFPQLNAPMATFFGFTRGADVVGEYAARKMGCSSSYDTASMISMASMLFFYLRYNSTHNSRHLIFVALSFLACTMSSRVGMVLGMLIFTVLFINLSFKMKGVRRWMMVMIGLGGVAFAYYFLLPVLAYSLGIYLVEEGYGNTLIASGDYGSTGTLVALTSTHLNALRAPLSDLLIGFGLDPNISDATASDIGYVKLIYHIGIIGLLLILSLHFYIFRRARAIRRASVLQSDEHMLASFLVYYIILVVVMNYKSLEMYSRGSHELLLILFFVLANGYASGAGLLGGKAGPPVAVREPLAPGMPSR